MKNVSIIIPVYNVQKYLSRCVESVLDQTYDGYELILIDDGSSDNSGIMCDQYAIKDKRIKVIHKENGGLSSARNAGLEIAQGEFVFFLDSDDVIHPHTMETLTSELKKDVDVVIGGFRRFSLDDELSHELIRNTKLSEIIGGGEQCIEKMYDSHEIASQYVSACGKLFRRSLFENVRFPVGRLFEDEFTTYRLYYKARRIMLYNNPLYFYFVNENGITRNLTLQKYFDEFDAQWERILFYKEKNLETLYHKAILYFLESTKWNLISCRKKTENYDIERGKNFEQQYAEAFRLAKKEKILNFIDHYDYFVLGNPKAVLYYRIKRLLLRHL